MVFTFPEDNYYNRFLYEVDNEGTAENEATPYNDISDVYGLVFQINGFRY
jgi:hypothetical protein